MNDKTRLSDGAKGTSEEICHAVPKRQAAAWHLMGVMPTGTILDASWAAWRESETL